MKLGIHNRLFAAAIRLQNTSGYQSQKVEGSVSGCITKLPGPYSHLSTGRLREITAKKLREVSSEALVEEQKPFTCTFISHLFITLHARVSPAAVNPSLIGAHYQPSLEDQL